MPPQTPEAWLERLEPKLTAQQEEVEKYERYYNGEHQLLFATLKFRQAFGWLFQALSDNWCLPTGSPIVTPSGLRPINEIEKGDFVFGHDGQSHRVMAVSTRAVDEDIVAFRTYGSEVCRMTAEHPVLATRRSSLRSVTSKYSTPTDHFRCFGTGPNLAFCRSDVKREWIPAGDLRKGDLVWSTVPRPTTDSISREWARLLGWYLAEGSISDNGRVAFTFAGHETKAQREVEALLKALANDHVTRVADHRSNTVQVVTYSKSFAAKLERMGGRGCAGKRIAPELMSRTGLLPLVIAAWEGDGTTPNGRQSTLQFTTTSCVLAEQMQQLLLRYKLACSRGSKTGRGRRRAYTLTLSGAAARSMAAHQDGSLRATKYDKAPPAVFVDGYVGYAIAEVSREQYAGDVHNIETAESHSFLLPGAVAVHNCELVCDAPVERLFVEGFRFGKGKPADEDAWAIWQANGLDALSVMAHTEAVKDGRAYILVAPPLSGEKYPRITVEHASQVYVETAAGDRRRRLAALKKWREDGMEFATLYLPTEIVKWQAKVSDSGTRQGEWERRDGGGGNAMGVVPMIPLLNNPTMLKGGRSDLLPAMPLQDAINKEIADMMVASEFAAFRQRWVTGMSVETDDEGNPLPSENVNQLKMSVARLMVAEEEGAKFGSFEASNLSNYVVAISMLLQHLAAQTRTPPHYLLGQIVNVSGDALKAAETGLVAKVKRKQIDFSDSWEEAMRLALGLAGKTEPAEALGAETIWRDPEYRSEGEQVDAALKRRALAIPLPAIWEMLGATPQQVKEWLDQLEKEEKLASVGASATLASATSTAGSTEPALPQVTIQERSLN